MSERQRARIVQAIANHQYAVTFRLQFFQALDLVARRRLGAPMRDGERPGDVANRFVAVSGQNFHSISGLIECPDCLDRILEYMVGEMELNRGLIAFGKPEGTARIALLIRADPFSRPQPAGDGVNNALKAEPRKLANASREPSGSGRFDQSPRKWVSAGPGQLSRVSKYAGGNSVHEARCAQGKGAGLVEDHVVALSEAFESIT
jgi:hypothetical protein